MLLRVFLRDGRTLTFDPLERAEEWAEAQSRPEFQASISGVGVQREDMVHMLPAPTRGFDRLAFSAEVARKEDGAAAALVVSCQADEILARLTVYYNGSPRMTRIDIKRLGKPRFVPAGLPSPARRR